MKITLVGPANPYRGGIAKFYDTLAANIYAKQTHEVLIVNFAMQYPSFLFPGTSQYTKEEQQPYKNIRIINSINPFSWQKAVNIILKEKTDIAVIRYWMPFMAPSLGFISRRLQKKGIKTIAITDNIIPHERHFFDIWLTRYFLKGIQKVICMSKKVEEELNDIGYKGKIICHHHPVYNSYGPKLSKDEACRALSLNPDIKYAMFFGFIREYKGLDILLKAWAKVDLKDVKLLIAGEFYSDPKDYYQLIDNLGIKDKIILKTKYIPEEDVNLYFSASELVIQPYRTASQSGISGIAYNYLVPMVVTDVGGLKESVTDEQEGYVIQPDENSLAGAIEKYFREDKKEYFSRNMEKRIGEFTWDGIIKCIEQ